MSTSISLSRFSHIFEHLVSVILLIAIAFYIVSAIWHTDFYGVDLGVYVRAASDAMRHTDVYRTTSGVYFVYPPFSLLLFIPLLLLPEKVGVQLWMIISLMCFFISTLLVNKVLFPKILLRTKLIIILYFLQTFSLKQTLYFGQINLILLSMITMAFFVSIRIKNHVIGQIIAGILIGVVVSFKIPPIVLVLYFLLKRQWVSVTAFFATIVVLNIVTIWLLGIRLDNLFTYFHFISNLSFTSRGFDFESSDSQLNQSINSFLNSVVSERMIRPITSAFIVILTGFMIAKCHFTSQVSKGLEKILYDWELYSFLLAIAILSVGMYSWEHHMVFLFPLLWLSIAKITQYSPLSKILLLYILVSFLVDPFDLKNFLQVHNVHGLMYEAIRYHGLFALITLLLVSFIEFHQERVLIRKLNRPQNQ